MVKIQPEIECAEGRVVRSESSRFLVDDGEQVVPCRLRGRIKRDTQLQVKSVVVGDRVLIRLTGPVPHPEAEGIIEEILPRSNLLSRAAAGGGRREQVLMANLDRVFIVMSTREPDFNARLLDRFLVGVAHQGLDAVICLNKCELASAAERIAMISTYREVGYPVLLVSAWEGAGLDRLRESMRGRTSFFLGPSGTGKSSLLSKIQPGLELVTRAVSRLTGKGRHSTTHTELHSLSFGGYVADSPGLREFGLWGVQPLDLARCFPEFRPYLEDCHYLNCSHSHEPDCGLKQAVEELRVDPRRYESYLRILESIREGKLSF